MSSTSPPNPKTHWRRFGVYYALAGIAILLTLYLFPSAESTVSQPLLATAHPAPGSSLVATLRTNMLNGSRNETITFEAARDPGTRIEQMMVCVDAPEFTPDPASGCTKVKVVSKGDIGSPPLPATIRLTPRKSSGSYKILITASWIRYTPKTQSAPPANGKQAAVAKSCTEDPDSCSPLAEQVEMTVGPVNLGIDKLSRFARRLSGFLKDLTLPIILVLLADWFSRESKKKEQRLKDQESKQDEERQIAHILLPKVMRLVGRYYLPMTYSASTFVQDSAAGRGKPKELAYDTFSFFLIARTLRDKEGGIFFKDLEAEQIFKISNNIIRGQVVAAVGGEGQFIACLNDLQTWVPTRENHWPRITERPATVPQAWPDLEAWLGRLDEKPFQAIRYLFNMLAATMRYESNVPYAYWYSNSKDENLFRVEDEKIAVPSDDAFGSANARDMEEFKKLLASYRKGKERAPK